MIPLTARALAMSLLAIAPAVRAENPPAAEVPPAANAAPPPAAGARAPARRRPPPIVLVVPVLAPLFLPLTLPSTATPRRRTAAPEAAQPAPVTPPQAEAAGSEP